MPLVFGQDTICPDCRHRDRRGNAYGRGWKWWRRDSLTREMVVRKERYPDPQWCKITCPTCGGTGVKKGSQK